MNVRRLNNVFAIKFLLLLLLLRVGGTLKPVILSEPQDVTVSTASFWISCIKSLGSSVAWYRNGRQVNTARYPDLQVSSDGSLHVKNARKERDEGSYYCMVSNWKGAVISRTATVKFAYLNPFTVGDWVVDAEEGKHTVISCKAPDSFPYRTIEWKKDGKQLPSQSAHLAISQQRDLHFAFLEKADEGVYECTVTNLFIKKKVVRTVTVFLTPGTAPLNKPPRVADDFSVPKTALKGEKFVLECIVYGKQVPKITLRKKGLHTTLGKTTGNINRLVMNSFGPDDAGKYKCKASDRSGQSDTKSTIITMEAKPEWILKPQDTTAGSNTTVTLPCIGYGIPRPTYTWFLNGKPLIWTNRHNITGGNLTIKDLTRQDSGMYQCFVNNKHGQLHADIELTVSEIPAGFGPGSKAPEPNTNALIHTSVELACNPTGEPKPVIRWLFNGLMYLKSTGKFQILSNGNLRISNVTKADTGYYICEASNRLGKATRKGHLNVLEYIIFTSNMNRSTSVVLGKNIRIMCGVKTISGIEITFQWTKYIVPVVSSPRVKITRTDSTDRLSYTSDMRGYLKITGAQYTDAGLYTCQIVGNKKIIASKNVLLIVKGPPDPPTNVNTNHGNTRGEFVNVTWTLGKSNKSPIKKVIIEHTTQFAPTAWKVIAEETEPEKGWTQIALSPWVHYTFRVVAVNVVGNSIPSAPSPSFQAPAAAPSKYPSNLRGVGTSPSTLKITWQPLPPIDHSGPGFYYVVYHQRADSKGQLFRNEVKNASSLDVYGADYYVKYMIQIQAANDIGFGPKSPVVFGYSGEKIPVGSPRDLDVRITSPTSAYATWTGVPDTREAVRGKLLGYKVYFWKSPGGQTPPPQAEYKATIDTSTTLHLQAYTSYRFQVVAYNSVGDGPASNVVGPLTTPESIPERPRGLALIVQNKSYVALQWSPPEKTNGIITDYQVSALKLPEMGKVMKWQTNDSTTELRIPQLDTQATYKISVLAMNRIGKGPPAMATFDLAAAPRSSPHNVTAGFHDMNQEVLLTWKSSLTDIEGFRIFYWSTKEDMQTVDVAKLKRRKQISIIGQDAKKVYHFQLAAFKVIHGGHYILGPKSKRVSAGKVQVRARKTKSSGSVFDSPSTLLLCSQLVFFMSLQWLQAR
ncbi:hypothetical protein ACROYT_G032745 [Oculina patagonica]